MNKSLIHIASSIALISVLFSGAVFADNTKASDDAKTVGQKAGEAVHAVGEAGKEVGHKVVETARVSAKKERWQCLTAMERCWDMCPIISHMKHFILLKKNIMQISIINLQNTKIIELCCKGLHHT